MRPTPFRSAAVLASLSAGLILALSACGTAEYSEDRGVEGVIPDNSHYIKKVDIEGTTCIIFSDANGEAISCDWGTP